MIDITNTNTPLLKQDGKEYWVKQYMNEEDPKGKLITVQVNPDQIRHKAGLLELIVENGCAFGHRTQVLIDGKPFPVRRIKLEGEVGKPWLVEMEFFPNLLQQ